MTIFLTLKVPSSSVAQWLECAVVNPKVAGSFPCRRNFFSKVFFTLFIYYFYYLFIGSSSRWFWCCFALQHCRSEHAIHLPLHHTPAHTMCHQHFHHHNPPKWWMMESTMVEVFSIGISLNFWKITLQYQSISMALARGIQRKPN